MAYESANRVPPSQCPHCPVLTLPTAALAPLWRHGPLAVFKASLNVSLTTRHARHPLVTISPTPIHPNLSHWSVSCGVPAVDVLTIGRQGPAALRRCRHSQRHDSGKSGLSHDRGDDRCYPCLKNTGRGATEADDPLADQARRSSSAPNSFPASPLATRLLIDGERHPEDEGEEKAKVGW